MRNLPIRLIASLIQSLTHDPDRRIESDPSRIDPAQMSDRIGSPPYRGGSAIRVDPESRLTHCISRIDSDLIRLDPDRSEQARHFDCDLHVGRAIAADGGAA
jgi:hypothetical protein